MEVEVKMKTIPKLLNLDMMNLKSPIPNLVIFDLTLIDYQPYTEYNA